MQSIAENYTFARNAQKDNPCWYCAIAFTWAPTEMEKEMQKR